MSYINLVEVKNKNNKNLSMEISGTELKLCARKDLIVGVRFKELVFLDIKLEVGDEIRYVEGDRTLIVIDLAGKVLKQKAPDYVTKHSGYIVEYQRHYPGEKFVVIPRVYYKEEQEGEILEGMTFSFYPNNGQLNPGSLSQTISLEGGRGAKSPLVKMLKFAHKKRASSVSLKHDNIELFIPGVGPTPVKKKKKVLKVWKELLGSGSKDTEWIISKFGIDL